MSEILLKADDARNAANDMRSRADVAQEQFSATRAKLTELGASFKGKTADAFDRTFEEWRSNADRLLESLNELSRFLDTAANTIEETDQSIANQLNG
jgi:WXG100 family type VII secretion target